jgi:hypothetical protein
MTIDVRPPSERWHPGYHSGEWYGGFPGTTGNTTSAANTIYLSPLPVFVDVTISDIAFNETGAATTSQHARMAVYADSAGVPAGAPLREGASELDLVANGIASASFTLTASLKLSRGLVWIAAWFETSGGTFASFGRLANTATNSMMIGATSAAGVVGSANASAYGYTMSSAYGSSFPTLASLSRNITPIVAFKVA